MSKCPRCGTEGAYLGLIRVECTNPQCVHYCAGLVFRGFVFSRNPDPEAYHVYYVDAQGKTTHLPDCLACDHAAKKKGVSK